MAKSLRAVISASEKKTKVYPTDKLIACTARERERQRERENMDGWTDRKVDGQTDRQTGNKKGWSGKGICREGVTGFF